jgi:Fe-S-cluster containining protein
VNRDAIKAAKRLLPLYHQHIDPWAVKAKEIASCNRGCNSCCYQLVGSSLSEGAMIAAHLMETPSWVPEIRQIRARLQEDSALIRSMKDKPHEWMVSKRACPFLDKKSGDCRIYSVRPGACRTYFVTSDPENCSPDRPGAEIQFIGAEQVLGPMVIEIISRTQESIPPLTGSLQSMVLAGMELISHSTSKFQKWLQTHPCDDMITGDEMIRSVG